MWILGGLSLCTEMQIPSALTLLAALQELPEAGKCLLVSRYGEGKGQHEQEMGRRGTTTIQWQKGTEGGQENFKSSALSDI